MSRLLRMLDYSFLQWKSRIAVVCSIPSKAFHIVESCISMGRVSDTEVIDMVSIELQ